jgi:hypothetical protein
MLTYLFTTSILLFVFAAGFYVFLMQSPPLTLRRRVLLLGIMGAVLLPLLPAPSFPSVLSSGASPERVVENWVYYDSEFAQAAPVIKDGMVPTSNSTVAYALRRASTPKSLLILSYRLIVFLFLGRMFYGLIRLKNIVRSSRPTGEKDIRLISGAGEAFTFGKTIYLSEAVYDSADAAVIIAHERAHAGQLHTADALLTEVLRAVFWFHPLAWWLRDQVQLNLEYLADDAVLRAGYDRRAYQLSLVAHQQGTDFRTSLLPQFAAKGLKRRIVMMGFRPGSSIRSLLAVGAITFLGFLAFACVKGDGAEKLDGAASSEAPIAPIFNGEVTELNVYFKRLPTPQEVAKIRPYLKDYFDKDLIVYQSCSEPQGSYQLYLGRNNETGTGATSWTTDYYSDEPIRFQLTKNGSGGSGGSSFRPMPAPAGAPDEDVLLRVNDEWISMVVPGSDPYTSTTLDSPILATQLECRLGITPDNKKGNRWKASKTVLLGSSNLEAVNSTLEDNGLESLPRTYYVGERLVDEQTFEASGSNIKHMLYMAALTESSNDNVVLMVME